jgi:exodeoxyribonuclease V alpha subunit
MKLRELTRNSWPGSARTPLQALDLAFAQFCQQQQPSEVLEHRWLAALTSYQWGRGHACLDLQDWPAQAASVLNWTAEQCQSLPTNLHLTANNLPWAQGEQSPLVWDGQRLYLRRAWQAEQTIRHNLSTRLQQTLSPPADLEAQLDALFGPPTQTQDMQLLACAHAAQHAVTLITGGPGTGKTTTVVKLLRLLQAHATTPLRMVLTAPTGKAAARLSQTLSQARSLLPDNPAQALPDTALTLHRWLISEPAQAHTSHAPDVVVVDEASMIDLELMARLLQAVPLSARLVLLGDKDQLASVEAGAVMAQLCQGKLLSAHTISLVHSHRFDATQGIGQWARAANTGNAQALHMLWQQAPSGCFAGDAVVSRLHESRSTHTATLAQLQAGWQPWLDQLADFQNGVTACNDETALALLQSFTRVGVLCALREGRWGVQGFNQQLQQALGFTDQTWFVGRPVMARRNDYALGIMNGDLGLCLPRKVDGAIRLRVAFADAHGGVRWQVPGRLDDVDTVFAMTVHQSQGSEFEQVLLVLPDKPVPLLTRELIYTGMTRAKKRLCVWAPAPELLMQAVEKQVQRSGGLD